MMYKHSYRKGYKIIKHRTDKNQLSEEFDLRLSDKIKTIIFLPFFLWYENWTTTWKKFEYWHYCSPELTLFLFTTLSLG